MDKRGRSKQPEDQARKFIDAARELGCDEDESHFEAALKKVARHKPPHDKSAELKQPKDGKGDDHSS